MRKKTIKSWLLLFVFSVILLSGCAVANPLVGTYNDDGNIAGFWAGLLHGLIAPITLFISLFNSEINIYEVFNTGFGYNAGFLLGLLIWAGGAYGSNN